MTAKEAKSKIGMDVRFKGRKYELRELIYWKDMVERRYRWSAMLVERETNSGLRVALEEVEAEV